MADQNKDVNLRIRATDESPGVLKGTKKNIEGLTSALRDQAKAAESAADAAAENYVATGKALEAAQEKAFSARKAFDAFAKTLSGSNEPTRKQVREFESLGRAAERADKDVERITNRLQNAEKTFNTKFSLYESVLGTEQDRAKAERASLGFATVLEDAQEAQQRLARLDAFRQIGEDAEVSASRLRTFGGAANSVDGAAAGLANSLRSIIDPAGAARASLDGLESEVQRVVAVVGDADKPIREYQQSIYELGAIQSDILRQGAAVDQYQQQEVAVKAASRAFEEAQQDVLRYAAAIRASDAPNDALVANLRQAESALESSNRELESQSAKLLRLKAPLDAAGISVDKLAAAENRLKVAAQQTAAASVKLQEASSGKSGPVSFLGLKPYELTNLGYQLNDVFTQIASGTSVMQTFAQQGPQIVQIFPQLLTGALRLLPVLGPLAVVFGTLALGMGRVFGLEASVRSFSAALEINADGARYNAEALAADAEALGRYGLNLSEASKALKAFVAVGADPTQLQELTKTALDFADATGKKLPDAVEIMTDKLYKGMEAVDELDKSLNFLTAAERERIETLFDSGQAEEARTEVARIFAREMDSAAQKNRSEWQVVTRELDGAWQGFLSTLANTGVITRMATALKNLVNDAKEVVLWFQRVNDAAPGEAKTGTMLFGDNAVGRYLDAREAKNRPNRYKAPARSGKDATTVRAEAEAKAVARLEDEYKKLGDQVNKTNRLETAASEARKKAANAGLNNANTQRVVAAAVAAEQLKIDKETAKSAESAGKKREAAARKSAAAERKLQAEAEAAIRRREALENQLVNAQAQLNARAGRSQKDDLDARLGAIDDQYAKIFKTIEDYQKAGGAKINGQSIVDFTAAVEQSKTLLKQQEQMAFYEDGLKSLAEQRANEFERITDAQDAGRLTSAQAYAEMQRSQEVLGPQIAKMAQDAIDFAVGIGGAKPSPAMKAFIAEMEKLRDGANRTGPNSVIAQGGQELLARDQGALNATIAERNALVQATNELYKVGAISAKEAQERIEAAFSRTTPTILAQSKAVIELARQLYETGAITKEAFDLIQARLALTAQQTTALDTPMRRMLEDIRDFAVSGAMDVFDTAAQGIAGLLDGTMSLSEALGNVGRAFLQFAADFLRMIAKMILQQLVFNAISGALGLGGGGGAAVPVAHSGKLMSEPGGRYRRVDPAVFLNAPRYHSGSPGVGLAADEQAAILKKNEEVLTEDNPRHIKNWKGNAPVAVSPQDVKIVNVSNPADVLAQALADKAGQRVLMNFIRDNPAAMGAMRGRGS